MARQGFNRTHESPYNIVGASQNANQIAFSQAMTTNELDLNVPEIANYLRSHGTASDHMDNLQQLRIGQNNWTEIDEMLQDDEMKGDNFQSNFGVEAWDQNMDSPHQGVQLESSAPHGLPADVSTSNGNMERLETFQSDIDAQMQDNIPWYTQPVNENLVENYNIDGQPWPVANNLTSPQQQSIQHYPDPPDPIPSVDTSTDDPMQINNFYNICSSHAFREAIRMHPQFSSLSLAGPSNVFASSATTSPNFTTGSTSPALTNNTMGSPAPSHPVGLQRNIKQSPKQCPSCPKRFIPSEKNGGSRCTRCQKKHERSIRGPKAYTMDALVPDFDAARNEVYPHLPPLNIPNDDVYTWMQAWDSENIAVGRLLTAVTKVYDSPSSSSSESPSAAIAPERNRSEDAPRRSSRRASTSSSPARSDDQSQQLHLNPGEAPDMSDFYLRQQDFFNKKNFDNHTVNVRLRLLYRAILTYHAGGPSVYPSGGDNAGYNTKDTTSTFSVRFQAIEDVLRLDKRVVSDVVEGRGVCALVQDPWGYERRKTDNETSNRKKKGLHNLGKGVQAQNGQNGDGDDEMEDDEAPLSRAQGKRPKL